MDTKEFLVLADAYHQRNCAPQDAGMEKINKNATEEVRFNQSWIPPPQVCFKKKTNQRLVVTELTVLVLMRSSGHTKTKMYL